MKRNQIIIVAACALLCAAIYLFADTRRAKHETAPVAASAESGHAPQQPESLNIESYITEVNSKISDKATRERVEKLTASKSYRDLTIEYTRLDKPLAVAWYSVLLAKQEDRPESLVKAGDYNALLIQTAPDDKARNFLGDNVLACYKRAVELDSTNIQNRLRLASAYMENGGQPMQGVAILLDIVRKDSNNVDAQLMLGRFGIISGQFDKAIARLEKIIYLQPQNSEALLLLAEAYNGKGNKDKAVELLERCKKTVPNPEARKQIDDYIKKIRTPNGANS